MEVTLTKYTQNPISCIEAATVTIVNQQRELLQKVAICPVMKVCLNLQILHFIFPV